MIIVIYKLDIATIKMIDNGFYKLNTTGEWMLIMTENLV